MSDVKAFNNCMSVFWRQHEAEITAWQLLNRLRLS